VSVDIIRFLRMVAPEDPATWFTIHRRVFVPGKDKPIFPGNAHKTVRSAASDVKFWGFQHRDGGHDIYISMGMYRNSGAQTGLYPKADRTYPNLVACKNLYMDVDVKQDGYATTQDAAAAIKDFLLWSKLPMPTVMVASGSGGFHVYWTLTIACDRAEHSNMARRLINAAIEYGLKFDRECTIDATRLLRVAGTWNYKHATDEIPPTEVKLLRCAKEHIDIDLMKEQLSRWAATITHEGKPVLGVSASAGVDAHGLPLDENADLTGGMKSGYVPVSIDEVAVHCPFVKNTLEAGGANLVGDPQWHNVVALACHTTEPRETAHRLCSKSPYYTEEGTDEKLAAAQLARANRETIGPPKCDHIAIERDECKTCPHLALHTTPLSVGLKIKQTNGHTFKFAPSLVPPGTKAIDLPYPYYQDVNFLVYKSQSDDGKPNASDGKVFEYPLLPGAMLEAGKPFQFVINTMQGERAVSKRFDSTIVAESTTFAKAFAAEGLPLTIRPDLPRQFMASYLQLLQSKSDTIVTVPAFGWSQDLNGDMGFAFAGEFVSPAGTVKCARPQEGTDNYRVMGEEKIWVDLMKLIVTEDRPDLACMVASTFAAPLVGMTGESGLLMGVTSPASGIGKSTALMAGQTVWSSPVVGGLTDTVNYTFAKCSTLRHLPVFYDEIKGEKGIRDMVAIAFQLTGGREKGRSDRSGKMRKVNEFKTLCGYAANGSIVAGVREEDKGTDASWLRIFEMQGIRLPESAPNFASNVNNLLVGLELNHGGVGRRYATFLGQNHAIIYKALAGYKAKFGEALGANPKVERFWVGAIATTILGASIANTLGVVNFPLNAMQQFMFSEFKRMQGEMAEDPSDLSKENSLIATIGAFLNEKQPRNMIKLDKTWSQPTRPPKGYATIYNDGPDSKWGKLEVQVSGEPLTIRISDSALSEWCLKTKRPKNMLVDSLKRLVNARMSTGMIGSGSRLAGARENVWIIPVTGTILEEMTEYGIHHKFSAP
jgi:hypothetical protein